MYIGRLVPIMYTVYSICLVVLLLSLHFLIVFVYVEKSVPADCIHYLWSCGRLAIVSMSAGLLLLLYTTEVHIRVCPH